MATLLKLVVQDFRNIALAQLDFSPNLNCISGGNGEGKTNLLDAIHYMSMTKSAFSVSDQYNFRHGTQAFSMGGTYAMKDGTLSRFALSVSASGEKKVRRDDVSYKKVSDHIGVLPVVMVAPSDSAMVNESGESRRRFLNSVLSQIDRSYLSDMQQYNRLLANRNKALKEPLGDDGLLDVFDERMSQAAERIYQARKKFSQELDPAVAEYYRSLSSGRERVRIEFSSDLDKGCLADQLRLNREKDKFLKFTSVGVQRDDLLFLMDGHPLRRCGSQGQQKSFLVSLKFAQYGLMKKSYGVPPILLLDDVFDKLDLGRISNLLSMVAGNDFGQIFITDSNKVRLQGIVDAITTDRAYFETAGGSFTKA